MSNQLNFNLNVDSGSAVASINQFFQTFEQGAAKAKSVLNKELGEPLQKDVIITMKGGKAVAQEIQSVSQTSQKLGQAAKALNGEWGKTPNALRQQLQILKEIQGNTQKYQNGTVKVTEEWKRITKAIDDANKRMKGFGPGKLEQLGNALKGTFGQFVAVQTAANLVTSAIQGIGAGFASVIEGGAKMEVLNLQLEAFTGSAENAQMAMKSFTDTAVKTPFNIEQVANAGRIMLGFGLSTEDAIKSTERLAVAASATDGDLSNLARNLGQIQAQGRAYTRDLTQFAIQGIPIWDEMAKVTGKTTVELKKMAEEGQIGFSVVQGAMANLTREGSAFWELSNRMQDTFKGRIEAIGSELKTMGASFIEMVQSFDASTGIITGLFELIKGTISNLGQVFGFVKDRMQGLIPVIGAVGATLSVLGLAAIAANWTSIVNGINNAVKAFKALNTVTALNNALEKTRLLLAGPKGWAIIAVAVAAGAFSYMGLNAAIDANIKKEEEKQAAIDKSTKILEEQEQRQQELIAQYGEHEGRMMSLEERLASLLKRFASGAITQEQFRKELQDIEDGMKALESVADGTADKVLQLKQAMASLKEEKEIKMEQFADASKAIDKEKEANDRRHNDVMDNYSKEKDAVKQKADTSKRSVDDAGKQEDSRHKTAMQNIDNESKAVTQQIDKSIQDAKSASEGKIANLEAEKQAAQAAGEAAIRGLEAQKTKLQQQHDSRMSQIRAQSEAAISALDREKAKIDEITNAQLAAIRQLSPAEKELAAIKQQKLQAAARNSSLSREERLEAQAQLDQMKRQSQEAQILEEQKKKQQVIDQQIAAEKQKQQEAEKQEQAIFDEKMAKLEKAIVMQQSANERKLQAIDAQIAKEKEQSEAEIQSLEEKKQKSQEALDAIKQQEQNRHEANKEALANEKTAIEDKYKAETEAIDAVIENEKERKEQQDQNFEDRKQAIQDEKDAYEKYHNERMKQLEQQKSELEGQKTAVDSVGPSVVSLEGKYKNLTSQIREARIEAEKLAAAQGGKKAENINSRTGLGKNASYGGYQNSKDYRFAGGPVTGGTAYTVNELGKEAFLSAAGRLSMINAPSFGTWRAPSSGTVIPAHLTSQLAIPRGGINLNGNVNNSAAAAGTGGVAAMARALMNSRGGDRINNTVTIQAQNPTKAASDMLVSLTKIRRRRYS